VNQCILKPDIFLIYFYRKHQCTHHLTPLQDYPPDRRTLSATTGIFAYILLNDSGTPTTIEIAAVSFLLISLIAFATTPRKLTKPLQQPYCQN